MYDLRTVSKVHIFSLVFYLTKVMVFSLNVLHEIEKSCKIFTWRSYYSNF